MSKNRDKLVSHIFESRVGFTVIPNRIWSMQISNNAKLIYTYIVSNQETYDPGYKDIRDRCGLGNSSIRSATKELHEHNMVVRRPDGQGYIYALTYPEEWTQEPVSYDDSADPDTELCPERTTGQDDLVGSGHRTGTIQTQGWYDPDTDLVRSGHTPMNNKKTNQETTKEQPGEPVGYADTGNLSPRIPQMKKSFLNDSEVNRSDTPSFRTMIGLLQQQNGNKIPRAAEIPPFVSSCKDRGLTVDDISTREFIKVFFDGAKALKKKVGQDKFTEWKESVENQLEQAKAAVYFAGSLDMNSEPEIQKGKIIVNHRGESNLHEETFDDIFPNFIVSENDD